MKRKRSADLKAGHACSKMIRQCTNQQQKNIMGTKTCRLLSILTQYGLLVSIVSNLAPEDLFSLAATSKATYKTIFSSSESLKNILGRMPCDGKGVSLRRAIHQRSDASTGPRCIALDFCGSDITTKNIETRPCEICFHTTCDECRIHCVFNSTIEPEEEDGDLPTYSGFILMDPLDRGILTFAHFGNSDCSGLPTKMPYHDQGFVDTPWTCTMVAGPELVYSFINFNLQSPLRLRHHSSARHPSPVIEPFWKFTEGTFVCNY